MKFTHLILIITLFLNLVCIENLSAQTKGKKSKNDVEEPAMPQPGHLTPPPPKATTAEAPENISMNKEGTRIAYIMGTKLYCYGIPEKKILWSTQEKFPNIILKNHPPIFLNNQKKILITGLSNSGDLSTDIILVDQENGKFINKVATTSEILYDLYVTYDEKYILMQTIFKLISYDLNNSAIKEVKTSVMERKMGVPANGSSNFITYTNMLGKLEKIITYDYTKGTKSKEEDSKFSLNADSFMLLSDCLNYTDSMALLPFQNSYTHRYITLGINLQSQTLSCRLNYKLVKCAGDGTMLMMDENNNYYFKSMAMAAPIVLTHLTIKYDHPFGFYCTSITSNTIAFIGEDKIGIIQIANNKASAINWIKFL